jgi:hypothetical protein
MSQVSGAIVVDLDLDRLADLLAARIAARLAGRPGGSDEYVRDDPPVDWSGTGRPWSGPRYGAVGDSGLVAEGGDPS